jgi:hypothetical protein
MVHISNHPGMNDRPVEAAVLRRQSHHISQYTNKPIGWGGEKARKHAGKVSGSNGGEHENVCLLGRFSV